MAKETKSRVSEQGKFAPVPAGGENLQSPSAASGVLFGLFLVECLIVCSRKISLGALFGESDWPERLLWVFAALTILASLAEQLHWQNVLSASAIVGLLVAGAYWLAPVVSPASASLFQSSGFLNWVLAWIVAVFAARGLAALLLEDQKKSSSYGLWLLCLGTILIAFFGGASQVRPGASPFIPVVWAVLGFLLQILATPWLIKDNLKPRSKGFLLPTVWILLHLVFALEALSTKSWNRLFIIIVGNAIIALDFVYKRKSRCSNEILDQVNE